MAFPERLTNGEVSATTVREELARILVSHEFARSPRLGRFLAFIIEETLSGRADRVKEYTVGLSVFDKGEAFDPKADSSVRTEAVKLRAKLSRYYEVYGRDDPVIITIPKGSYIAEFQSRATPLALEVEPPVLPLAGHPREKPRLRTQLILAALVAFAGIAAFITNPTKTEQQARPNVVPLTTYSGHQYGARFSPDGSQFVFMWNGEQRDNVDLYVRLVEGEPPLRITTDPAQDWSPAWSPDGNWIAFIREPWGRGEVRLIRPLGGTERLIAHSRGGSWLAWSPDAKLLAMADRPTDQSPLAIVLIEIGTGKKRQLTFPPVTAQGDINFAFSPDGKRMAFVRDTGSQDLYIVPIEGGEPRPLSKGLGLIYGVDWMPEGRSLVFSRLDETEAHLWELPLTGLTHREPHRLAAVKEPAKHPTVFRGALGRKPLIAFESGTDDVDLWTVDVTPGPSQEERRFSQNSTQADVNPQYSPDGGWIVFASYRTGNPELWLCAGDGSHLQQLTHVSARQLGSPRWAPDGRRIAFDMLDDAGAAVYALDIQTRQLQRLTAGNRGEARPSWSHDGAWIYFHSDRSGRQEIWKRPSRGGEPIQVTRQGGFEALESPDGQQLFYCKQWNHDGLWRMPVGGGPEAFVHQSVGQAWWDVAKSGIYFIEPIPRTRDLAINLLRFSNYEISRLRVIHGPLPLHTPVLAVSPDEQQITYAKFEHVTRGLMMLENVP